MSDDNHNSGGFMGGITLGGIVWGLLVWATTMVVGIVIFLISAFVIYVAWDQAERHINGRTETFPRQLPDGTYDTSRMNRADLGDVVDYIGYVIYAIVGLAFAALFIAAISQMKW